MKVCIIGSGSKGNCTYIETPQTKILIDAGLNMLTIKKRLSNQGVVLKDLDAIFISHEHSDHISQLISVMKNTNATLYINKKSYTEANRKLKGELKNLPKVFITCDNKYTINDVCIVPVELSHDTKCCYGFLFKELNTEANITFASITDTGFIPTKYYPILSTVNVLFIESNYDVEMLLNSSRPWFLIQRIIADEGHMSNEQSLGHVKHFLSKHNKKIILAHISEECNTYELARKYFLDNIGKEHEVSIDVAYQNVEYPIFEIGEQDD